ncbi:MAG TPA: alpha/beta fold hydrolase [Candidatus Limnocylindria bacterium]|nr:alpha/beta fold hydrolase [Candidatus Limnocylindria bacterium]
MRRAVLAVLLAVLLAWLVAPMARAYQLVAGRSSDPAAPRDLRVEDLRFKAGPDRVASGLNVELAAWTIHTVHGAPAVVLVHGFKTSREEMLPWARFLHDGGFNVLLLDTRGCGRSGGSIVGLGATEPRDISLAVDAARDQFGTTRVAVLGISLGAGAAILAAADDPRISAVVADSAWTDQDFQLSRLSFLSIGPIRVPLPPYGVAAVNVLVGADVTKARPLEAIARISPRPVLLIHSADDGNATTPVDGARRLFAAAGEPKELWIAPRGGHVGAINGSPDEYRGRVLALLGSAFR